MLRFTHKRVLPFLTGILMLYSCSSSKNAGIAQRRDVKGAWTLDNIRYEGLSSGESLRLSLLDEGNEACLKGSAWVLPNNGYGSYTINSTQTGCTPGEKNIIWSYRTENGQAIIQYKKLVGGVKAKDIEEGYKFNLLSASDNAMSWRSEISFQGHPVFIIYDFSRK